MTVPAKTAKPASGDDLLDMVSTQDIVLPPNYSVPAGDTLTSSDLILVAGPAWNQPQEPNQNNQNFFVLIQTRTNQRESCYWGPLAEILSDGPFFSVATPDAMDIAKIKSHGTWLLAGSSLKGPIDLYTAREILRILVQRHAL